jgi:hypothetical protein
MKKVSASCIASMGGGNPTAWCGCSMLERCAACEHLCTNLIPTNYRPYVGAPPIYCQMCPVCAELLPYNTRLREVVEFKLLLRA